MRLMVFEKTLCGDGKEGRVRMTCNLHLPRFHALRPALQLLNSPFCSCTACAALSTLLAPCYRCVYQRGINRQQRERPPATLHILRVWIDSWQVTPMSSISTCTQIDALPEIFIALLTLKIKTSAGLETLSLVSLYIATPVVMSICHREPAWSSIEESTPKNFSPRYRLAPPWRSLMNA